MGNLTLISIEAALRPLFEPFGEVLQVKMMTDRETGKPRGFAFDEMREDEGAQKAITPLRGKDCEDRTLTVIQARHNCPNLDPAGSVP